MRKNKVLLIALMVCTLVLSGCRPKGILHSREMRSVITDLHKVDALLEVTNVSRYNSEVRSIYYAQVLEKHGITQAQFDSSLVWYTAHPQLFDKIYPRVMKNLEHEREDFLAQHPELENTNLYAPEEPAPQQETRPFTSTDLDSVLWVTLHGYGSSWGKWERPFSMQDFVE